MAQNIVQLLQVRLQCISRTDELMFRQSREETVAMTAQVCDLSATVESFLRLRPDAANRVHELATTMKSKFE